MSAHVPVEPVRRAPRNRVGHAEGQRRREVIKQVMLEWARRWPLCWPLTAAEMCVELQRRGIYLSVSTVTWHMEAIRAEADREREAATIAEKNDVSCARDML